MFCIGVNNMKQLYTRKRGNCSGNRPEPDILDERDAVIRVTLTTICSSDIHIKTELFPEQCREQFSDTNLSGSSSDGKSCEESKAGRPGGSQCRTFCGECFFCQRGFVNNCTDKIGGWALGCRIDGGQAEYVRIPFADNGLTVIPDHVTDEQALFNGDLLSTGYWAAKIGEIKPGETAAVIGAGPTGLCTMLCARLYGPSKIIAIDTDEFRLKLAKEKGLADVILAPGKDDIESRIRALTDGRGADTVFEAAGGKDTFQTAWKIARPNAIVTIVAMYGEPQILPLPDMYGKKSYFQDGRCGWMLLSGDYGSDCRGKA